MKKINLNWLFVTLPCVLMFLIIPTAVDAKGYGKVTGKFVFKGKIPQQVMLVNKQNAKLKQSQKAFANGIQSEELIIDSKTKGIKNIVVYIRRVKKKTIHPKFAISQVKVVEFQTEDFQFKPHFLSIRTDQKVKVKAKDKIATNIHPLFIRNKRPGFLFNPEGRTFKFEARESIPCLVQCVINPWMKAYWMILDHPYCAITKSDGTFEIDLIPAGEHQFRVWHEKKGYVKSGNKKGFKAIIQDGKTFDLGTIELTIDDFK